MRTTGRKEIASIKNGKEAFWETSFWSENSSHRIAAFSSRSPSLRLFSWNLQSDIWELIEGYGEKEIASDTHWKEAFWETALRCGSAPLWGTLFSSVMSLQDRFLEIRNGRLLRAMQLTVTRDVSSAKNEGSFLRNCFLICDFISPRCITVSWSRLLALCGWIPRTDVSDGFEEYGEKGNILPEKPECSFLRNSFVTCEFLSKGYTTLGSPRRDMVKKAMSSDKNWKEAFGETALWHVNATPRLTRSFSLMRLPTLFDGNLHWAVSRRNEAYGDQGNILQ